MGEIDVLIYNARGEFTACEPLDMSYAALEDIYRAEVLGAFAAAKPVLPAVIKRSRGGVFFSTATAAYLRSRTRPLNATGKFGVRALSQGLTKTCAEDAVHFVPYRRELVPDDP